MYARVHVCVCVCVCVIVLSCRAIILYDRPHEQFTPISVEQQHEVWLGHVQCCLLFAISDLIS